MTTFEVLIVCTANQCRSPMAEALLRHHVERLCLPWAVSSAGTRARQGHPMDTKAARVLTGRGLDPGAWRSRQIDPAMIRSADLILTASEENRTATITAEPSAMRRVFPLLQFTHLVSEHADQQVIPGRSAGPMLVQAAHEAQGSVQAMSPAAVNLKDPVGHSMISFRRCAATIDTALSRMLSLVL